MFVCRFGVDLCLWFVLHLSVCLFVRFLLFCFVRFECVSFVVVLRWCFCLVVSVVVFDVFSLYVVCFLCILFLCVLLCACVFC